MVVITERPAIFPEGDLPTFLSRDLAGLLIVQESFVKEGGRGSYDRVMDFGHSRDSLRETVPPEQRITKNTRNDLFFLGFDNPRITSRMREVARLANDPARSFDNPPDRNEYRMNLRLVYKDLARAVRGRIGHERALFFPPKNGGIFVKEVYQECGFPPEWFFDYQMSRILGVDGRLMVGVRLADNNPKITDARTFVVADDCLASDISAWGTLEIIKDRLTKQGIFPSEAEVLIAVSAATQRGLESLLSPQAKKHFGFKSLEAIAAIPVFKMTDNFYLQHLNGSYVVGDMGKWTRP